MTNLEYYKDEIKEKIKKGENFGCAICLAKNKNCLQCEADDGNDILCNIVDWLLEEHKEPIKLKQWEFDLLNELRKDWNYAERKVFWELHKKGYFKGVFDIGMSPKEILENCEVIDE